MISIGIVGDKQVIARMESRSSKLLPALTKTMTIQAFNLQRYIQTQKLQTQPLHHRSGRLQGSIHNSVTTTNQAVNAKVYTNVSYARIHEYGGQTPPHVIYPKNGKALKFLSGGKTIFAKKVNHPGSKMPQRSFMRSSLNENKSVIINAINETVAGVMRAP